LESEHRAESSAEAIRSVSHLDLAPHTQRSFSGSFFFLYIKSFFVFVFFLVFLAIDPSAHPATSGTRKLSVPGRVHSVSKSCGYQEAFLPPKSNPFLTHGTVESPAKLSYAAQ